MHQDEALEELNYFGSSMFQWFFSQKGTHEYIVLYFAHNRFEKSSLENAFTFILLGMNGTQKHCHHELKESIFETIIAKMRKAFVFSLLVIISFKLKTPYPFS